MQAIRAPSCHDEHAPRAWPTDKSGPVAVGVVEDSWKITGAVVSAGAYVGGKSVVCDGAFISGGSSVIDKSIVSGAFVPPGVCLHDATVLACSWVQVGSIGATEWYAYTRWTDVGKWRVWMVIGCQELWLDDLDEHNVLDFATQFSEDRRDYYASVIRAARELVRVAILVPEWRFDRKGFLAERGIEE